MKTIGGMFSFVETNPQDNGFFSQFQTANDDLVFMMSGRCGIYHCLMDNLAHDTKRVAYVPVYTCETVLAPFVKAGYTLKFYDIDENLCPVFDPQAIDEISLLSLCGYYGFCSYDHSFVQACKDRGITIFEDVTHSIFSTDGIDPLCDYVAGSFRKWMGVNCGGFALKRNGKFLDAALPVDPTHLSLRRKAIETAGNDAFWEGEMLLRRMFDRYASDEESAYLLRHADFEQIASARRANFAAILSGLSDDLQGVRPVFPALTESAVPSHFVAYADEREDLQAYLAKLNIRSTVYWPVGPEVNLDGYDTARYIYDHIVAIPCDQRYNAEDMARISDALNKYIPSSLV